MTEQIWQKSDGEKLKKLRISANINAADMARWAAISVNQLQQLEEGGDSFFYSQQIKYNMGCKLLKLFGDLPGEPANSNKTQKLDAQSVEMLDQVIDINERDLAPDKSTKLSDIIQNFWTHYKIALIVFILVAIAISLDVYYTTFMNKEKADKANISAVSNKNDLSITVPRPLNSSAPVASENKK